MLRAVRAAMRDAPPLERDDSPRETIRLTPLAGGLGRRSYLATVGDRAWVVRRSSAPALGALDVRAESDVMRTAAAAGLAPQVVSVDSRAQILITEYRAGAAMWDTAAVRRPENIARVAALLKRLHQLRPALRGFDPLGFASEYLAALNGDAALDAADRRLAAELSLLAKQYHGRYPQIALCHNDLFAANVLDDGSLKLIDFEYAVVAAPILDLAGLAAMNDFGRYERLQLVEAYYAGSPVPFSSSELDRVIRLVDLLAYFWALSSTRTAAEPEPFAALVAGLAMKLGR